MKLKVSNKGWELKEVTSEQLQVIIYLLDTANSRCFGDEWYDGVIGKYCDGGDFVASINAEQRDALRSFIGSFHGEFDKLKNNIQKKKA